MHKSLIAVAAMATACFVLLVPDAALAATSGVHGFSHAFGSIGSLGLLAAAFAGSLALEQKDANDVPGDPGAAIEKIATAFEAFRKSHDEQITELKKGVSDPVLIERLSKIEKSLDDGSEAKQQFEAAIAAERKEREELELKFQRFGIKGTGDAAVAEVELKSFNLKLAAEAAERKLGFVPLDAKGYDEYKSAYGAFLRKNERVLTAEEVKTLQVGSDPDGGYLVPEDTSGRIVKKVFETSPIRQIASVQAISGNSLEGLEDRDEAGVGYAGEHGTSGDTKTPQLGKWEIPVFNIDTEPKATQNLLDDAAIDVEAWLSGKIGDKFGRFENSEFVNGSANKIRGFAGGYATAADSGSGVSWGKIGYLKSGADGDFVADASFPADKLFDLIGLLRNQYLQNARIVTRRTVITKMRKFKSTTGDYLWQPSLMIGAPESFGGLPITRAEDMPALGAGSFSLAVGDFNQGYQIVDRLGIRVLRDPFTAKPYIKFYTTKRVGGGVIDYDAIKLMKFAA
jgi:HK97 family phage major capsid protein